MAKDREYYCRHLPHWQPHQATFFVTFRLKGSLPQEVIESLRAERKLEKREFARSREVERGKQDYLEEHGSFGRWDSLLDAARTGHHWLMQSDIAEIVKEAMHHRDGREYNLYAFCVMANHVHAVFRPIEKEHAPEFPLNKIMQSLKRHTARKANIVLGREGAFWQDESYDHVIRNSEEFLRILHYVVENPVKARLVSKWEDWPWTYCRPGLL